ncbi:LPD29 domain-containing protein [Anaerofustis sp.]|uniref:LPD29 domain-containing protein n=1 Tax=Anaerofustis sp. TaxID=1872517 RepID=UPI0025C6440A|nr:LPD29 domain-containing protein [Anaerofustis sp.]
MLNITLNTEKNGIELRFDSKPSAEILTKIKENGYHWSNKQKIWYAKQSENTMTIANEIAETIGTFTPAEKSKQEKLQSYDLWLLTRAEDVENHFEKYHIYDNKEIAARIRKHLKERFPMCKWSVTKNGYNSIYVHLLASPFTIDSEALKAIVHYAYIFAQSFNYDNSDSMTDYFDVNFYGVYESDIVSSYRYEQLESNMTEHNIEQEFINKKAVFEEEKREREERKFQERMAQLEAEKVESTKREAERQQRHNIIESGAIVKDMEYFVLKCNTTNASKEDTVNGYTNDYNGEIEVKHHRENCKVARNIYFDSATYEMFVNQLLDDYSFLSGMGGTATDDNRIICMEDYQRMSEEEKDSVEWYNNKCVAIYCDNTLKIIVNPEGYNYARYVYFVDKESEVVKTYSGNKGISDEELEKNKSLAESLEDVSTNIIINNNWLNTWNNEHFNEYKQLMKKWIYENNFKFSVDVVRAISIPDLKTAMYHLLTKADGMQEQFAIANFTENQKITIIRMNEFGGIGVTRGYFKDYTNTTYAQYDNAVKLVFRPERKRNDYYAYLYRDALIFNDWVEIPENLLWEDIESNTPECSVRKARFLSCDESQYDVILEYFKDNGIKPIINTYKPIFN